MKKVLGPVIYELQLPTAWKIHPLFHASLLLPHTRTKEYGETFTNPPPEKVEGEDNYEVEAVITHRKKANGTISV